MLTVYTNINSNGGYVSNDIQYLITSFSEERILKIDCIFMNYLYKKKYLHVVYDNR